MYLDSAYIAKFYVNEPDARAVRKLIEESDYICSSSWALVEVTCVFQRHMREGNLTLQAGRKLIDLFRTHANGDVWNMIPASPQMLLRTAALIRSLPASVRLRAGGAIHLATALEAGEEEIWTNDRHLLLAARHVGLAGMSVGP